MRGADGDLDLMFEQVDALRRLAHEVEHTDDEEHASALVYDFSIGRERRRPEADPVVEP